MDPNRPKGHQITPLFRHERAGAGKKRGIYVERKEKIKSSDVESVATLSTPLPPAAAPLPPTAGPSRDERRRYLRRIRTSAESVVVLKHKADIAQTPSLFSSYTLPPPPPRVEPEPTAAPSTHSFEDAADDAECFEEIDALVDDDHPIRFGQPTFEIKRSKDDNIFIPCGPPMPRTARPKPARRARRKTSKQSKEHLLRILKSELREEVLPMDPPNVYQVLCDLARRRGSRDEVSKNRRKCLGHTRRREERPAEEEWPSETSLVVYEYD